MEGTRAVQLSVLHQLAHRYNGVGSFQRLYRTIEQLLTQVSVSKFEE
jgi:hypothetical protein